MKAYHNYSQVSKSKSNEANGLHTELYIFEGSEVIITSSFWDGVGLHNCAKGGVDNFIYNS